MSPLIKGKSWDKQKLELMKKAKDAIDAKKWYSAKIHLDKILAQEPDNLDIHFLLVDCLVGSGMRQDALKCLEFVLEKDPEHEAAFMMYGPVLALNRRYGKAVEALEKAVSRYPDNNELRAILEDSREKQKEQEFYDRFAELGYPLVRVHGTVQGREIGRGKDYVMVSLAEAQKLVASIAAECIGSGKAVLFNELRAGTGLDDKGLRAVIGVEGSNSRFQEKYIEVEGHLLVLFGPR